MQPLNSDLDHVNLAEAAQEMQSEFGQPVVVLRFVQWVAGSQADYPPSRLDTNLATTAIVSNVTQEEVLTGGGLFQVGDIKTMTLLDIKEYRVDLQQEGDMLFFEGLRYKLIGKPRRVFRGGGRVWVNCTWRKIEG